MNKILSIKTIKNVFAALGAKTSDDNYGVALLDKTTAEPKGLMGMGDLASVIGESGTFTIKTSNFSGLVLERTISSGGAAIQFKNTTGDIGMIFTDSNTGELKYQKSINGKSYKINMTEV